MVIKKEILDIIERGKTDGNLYFLLGQQLDRKVYMDVNKVLECLGGKWNRKSRAHIFESDISDRIDNVLLTGEITDQKKEFQFFETPPDIVARLIELAKIEPGHTCLEPSAGRGNIAEAMRTIVGGLVWCIELEHTNAAILVQKGFAVHEEDFLQLSAKLRFDRIVMNPPFTRQQDIQHVLKALTYLENGGILISVMSAGVMFRQNKRTTEFWDKVKEYEYEVEEISKEAFRVSGTLVNTVILKVKG